MRRTTTLYSSSGRRLPAGRSRTAAPAAPSTTPPPTPPVAAKPARKLSRRVESLLLVAAGAGIAALFALLAGRSGPPPQPITQQDIDAAVRHTLETKPLPSVASRAAEAVRPSVVRVQGLKDDPDGYGDIEHGIGTGVVIVDKGLILTNLHVVAGADKVKVTFFDGLESDATVVSLQPENDLAVLQAQQVPDDLAPATLRSTQGPRARRRGGRGRLPVRHRPVGLVGRRLRPEARVPLAAGQARADEPDPVRRGGQPRAARAGRW